MCADGPMMLLSARLRLPTVFALLGLCALLVTGTALAQDDADDSAGGQQQEEVESSGDSDASADSATSDESPECEPDEDAKGRSKSGKGGADSTSTKKASEEGDGCIPPPRCADGEVDLAPNQDNPNCINQGRLNRLLADFETAAADEAVALEELRVALDQLAVLNDQLDTLQVRLGEVQVRLAGARVDARFAKIREAIAGEGLDDVAASLADEEGRLREQAVDAYLGGDEAELATTAALLQIESYGDVEIAREYATVILEDQVATVQDVEALRDAVQTLTEVMAEIELAAEADAERVDEIQDQVDEFIVQQRELVKSAEAETVAISERIADIQARKKAYAEQLRLRGIGGGAIGQLLRGRQVNQDGPGIATNLLALPLTQTRIGSGFGPRLHPIFNEPRLHTGIDMSGSSGSRILASAGGVVAYAEETQGYGNVVVVDHGNTVATLYAHMTADAVWVGQEVVEGELLGFVGSTGYSTGPHLHYEVRVNGQPVDPLPYLRLG